MGKKGEEVFPYIPFYQVLREKKAVPEKVIRLFGTNVSLAVVPVVRKEDCIGAFAMLQKFNEQESLPECPTKTADAERPLCPLYLR